MKRLLERHLMFANIVEVDSPALIDRCNRARNHLRRRTARPCSCAPRSAKTC